MKTLYTFLIFFIINTAFGQNQSTATNNNHIVTSASLSDFRALPKGRAVELLWVANYENNIASHQIERSDNGSNFRAIGTVIAQNVGTPFKYQYLDGTPVEGRNYYRLRTTDKNGVITYSDVLQVDNSFRRSNIMVLPNPVRNGVMNLQLTNFNSGRYNINLYSNAGQVVFAQTLTLSEGTSTQTILLPRTLGRGSYFLLVSNGNTTRLNRQILVQ